MEDARADHTLHSIQSPPLWALCWPRHMHMVFQLYLLFNSYAHRYIGGARIGMRWYNSAISAHAVTEGHTGIREFSQLLKIDSRLSDAGHRLSSARSLAQHN